MEASPSIWKHEGSCVPSEGTISSARDSLKFFFSFESHLDFIG